MINPMDLTGKRILVTGASSGIGAQTSVVLNELGASLFLLDINEKGLACMMAKLSGDGHGSKVINLACIDKLEDEIKSIIQTYGTFDGFVHCAGIAPMRPFHMSRKEDIQKVMDINFYSFVEISRVLTKVRGGFRAGGSIVVMSSTASIHGKPTKIAYSASKAAIDAAIRCMTVELKSKKIRVNSIMPSWVRTQMFTSYVEHYPDSIEIKEINEKQYLGVSEPYEVANVIAFLLSDATKTITGTTIIMDGGILQG